MEILMLIFAPFIGIFSGTIGINQALTEIRDKLYDGLDTFLDKIGLEN